MTPRDRLTRLMDGYLGTQLLYLAARLGIADGLATGPLASDAPGSGDFRGEPRARHAQGSGISNFWIR
jgi:hypothetical protein